MNFWILPLTAALLDLHVKSCPENQFQLPDKICCNFCAKGWYVDTNCTRQGRGVTGVKCSRCSVCANGTQMIASCTRFSDTRCTEREISKIESPKTSSETTDELLAVHVALYIIVPMVFMAITVAVGYKKCLRRSVYHDSSEKPLKTVV